MIDFLKFRVINIDVNLLRYNPLLTFHSNRNDDTGELTYIGRNGKGRTPYYFAIYLCFAIKIYVTGRIVISGSIHKYFNNGEHNANDFRYSDFIVSLNSLLKTLNLNPENCILENLEVGLNFKPLVNSQNFLNNIFLHRKKRSIQSRDGYYKQIEHSQYYVKIYDKAYQYSLDYPLIRFELKYIKMQKVNKLGYYTLLDLLTIGLNPFKDILIKELDQILYFDNTIKSNSRLLDKYNNPLYWYELASNKSKASLYKKHLSKLKELTRKNSDNILFHTILVVNNKIDYLLK